MVKKIIKKGVKKGIKKIKEQSGAPEPGTVGARKTTKAKPTGVTKAKPTGVRKKAAPTGVTKAKPTKGKGNLQAAKTILSPKTVKRNATTKVSPGMKAAISAPAVGLAALAVTGRKKPKATEAAKVTFGEAFKAARKKGEGTKFTWNGKSYTAVTKDDLKKKGYDANELRQYANRKGKARGPLRRAGQGIKKVLLGKDKKFGGDKGAIDFIRRPKKKAGGGMATGVSRSRMTPSQKSAAMRGPKKSGVAEIQEGLGQTRPGMKKGGMAVKKYKAGGLATKGLGKAYMNSKR